MHNCKKLNLFEFLLFQELILPCYRRTVADKLADKLADDRCTLLGAYCEGEVGGIAVIMHSNNKESQGCHLHSLAVNGKFRNRGIGTCLIKGALKIAKEKSATSLSLNYGRHYDWSEYLDRLSDNTGFEQTSEFEIYTIPFCHSELDQNLEYLTDLTAKKAEHFETGYSLIPLAEISEDQKQSIKDGFNVWYNHEVDPFQPGSKSNELCSLVLIKDDQIVGWSDVRNLDCKTVIFNTFFVRREIRGTGIFIYLLNGSLGKLKEQPQITKAIFKTNTNNRIMRSTMPKLLDRFYDIKKHKHVYKQLMIDQCC